MPEAQTSEPLPLMGIHLAVYSPEAGYDAACKILKQSMLDNLAADDFEILWRGCTRESIFDVPGHSDVLEAARGGKLLYIQNIIQGVEEIIVDAKAIRDAGVKFLCVVLSSHVSVRGESLLHEAEASHLINKIFQLGIQRGLSFQLLALSPA
jgi:hypothetical protein